MRKIALIGNAFTLNVTPYTDKSWEVWAHASTGMEARRVDVYFDLHPPHCFQIAHKNGFPNYYSWLKRLQTPIYMQQKFPEIPASKRYPKERILAEFRPYFASQTSWMIALALTKGVDVLGFFGIHYQSESEYFEQRANCEYWLGVAESRGVKLVFPEGCPLLQHPSQLYGYESHTKELYAARLARKKAAAEAAKKAQEYRAPVMLGPLTPIDNPEQLPQWKQLDWGQGDLGDGPAIERFYGGVNESEKREEFARV